MTFTLNFVLYCWFWLVSTFFFSRKLSFMDLFFCKQKHFLCIFKEVAFWEKYYIWPKFYCILLIWFRFLNCKYTFLCVKNTFYEFLEEWLFAENLTFNLHFNVSSLFILNFKLHIFYIFAKKSAFQGFFKRRILRRIWFSN